MDIKFILIAALVLVVIGLIAAVILFFVEKAFKVIEDPRIDEVADKLPGANCGGCGFAGCRALAEAIVKSGSMEGYNCPAGGDMPAIATIMGLTATVSEPKIAVMRCNGTCENAPAKVQYDSAKSCLYAHSFFAGEAGCAYGCLGCGDCVISCQFGALSIDEETRLIKVNEALCVGCNACVKCCPRGIIELRNKGKGGRRVFVSCCNKEKGAIAKKNCTVACIGCAKCAKTCTFEAITVADNLAYIDDSKCKLCRKCIAECPTGAIHAINFPIKKALLTSDIT
jgi:Na+-translocating ferredoxin:NAD+ oxidoreductase RNF subunit RnfB